MCEERAEAHLLLLPPACVLLHGASSASAGLHYGATAVMHQCVHAYAVNKVRAWVSASHAHLDTASSASALPDSLTGCARLAANGAGPRRCTAGVTPASVRTRDRRTEARTGPGPLCLCAPQKDQAGSAAVWRSPTSDDHEDDGRPSYPKRSRRHSATS